MWPLHVRSKDEYIRLIQNHLDNNQRSSLQEVVGQAFEDYEEEEDFTAWCSSVAHGTGLENAPALLARFTEKFPLSLHPVQVDLAEMLVTRGDFDQGSNESRAYLNRLHQNGLESFMREAELVQDGVSRALLLMTAVYTELGARSYSRRALEFGLMLPLTGFWQSRFQSEHRRLSDELGLPANQAADRKWETFFATGQGADEISGYCYHKGLNILAKRVETIAGRLASGQGYRVDDEELFQMLYQTDQGAYVLV